ncbi:MAG TPA: flagellar protein FliT [Ramlibacter sp.]|jgi:flagellar protein FliT|uniref:flagellar protein FliT n=1 Tax=Ramlibacter sp. TaxID=1917967 RepID=UPI002D6C5D6F|nr:flagellar protein FliT [Ramlibacter sp.]HZY19151.1 flagellar protein FliT [Ramlibacter sp.]
MPTFTPEDRLHERDASPAVQDDVRGGSIVVSGGPVPSALLRHYEALDCASEEMLEAARAGDWDSVCRLEGACALVISRLQSLARQQPLPPHEQRERMRILRAILARDAEIRRICEPMPSLLDATAWPLASPTTLH